MFNDSYLRVCMKLRIVQKIRFSIMSLGGPWHGARVWCLGRVPKHRNHWQELEGLLFSPKNSQLVHILSFCSQGVVSLFIFPTGMIALYSEPVEEDTSKIRDTTGTVFIQGPSIVLPVWRCIMFNGSFLRSCMKLWIVQKIRFPFLSLGGPSHGARVQCLGRVPKHRNHWQEVEGSPTSMEKHYVQWFILKSVQDITVCEKIRFCLLKSGQTKPW